MDRVVNGTNEEQLECSGEMSEMNLMDNGDIGTMEYLHRTRTCICHKRMIKIMSNM